MGLARVPGDMMVMTARLLIAQTRRRQSRRMIRPGKGDMCPTWVLVNSFQRTCAFDSPNILLWAGFNPVARPIHQLQDRQRLWHHRLTSFNLMILRGRARPFWRSALQRSRLCVRLSCLQTHSKTGRSFVKSRITTCLQRICRFQFG